MTNKTTLQPAEIDYRTHRLVNKRTGKLASSTNWLLDLAACAVVQGHSTGIPSLLPQSKAAKFLQNNELRPVRRHKKPAQIKAVATSPAELRALAKQAIPAIAVYYIQEIVSRKRASEVNRKGFVYWIVREMENPSSGLNQYLRASKELSGLVGAVRGERWWLDQLRMQSKSPNTP